MYQGSLLAELSEALRQAIEYAGRRGESTIRLDDLRLEHGWLKDIFVEAAFLNYYADNYIFELEISGRYKSSQGIQCLIRTLALDGASWMGPRDGRFVGSYRYGEAERQTFGKADLVDKLRGIPVQEIALALVAAWTNLP